MCSGNSICNIPPVIDSQRSRRRIHKMNGATPFSPCGQSTRRVDSITNPAYNEQTRFKNPVQISRSRCHHPFARLRSDIVSLKTFQGFKLSSRPRILNIHFMLIPGDPPHPSKATRRKTND